MELHDAQSKPKQKFEPYDFSELEDFGNLNKEKKYEIISKMPSHLRDILLGDEVAPEDVL